MRAAKGSARTPLGPILCLVWNVGYTTSKADKVKQGGFQRNSGHLRLCEQPRAAHALRSDQLLFQGPPPSTDHMKLEQPLTDVQYITKLPNSIKETYLLKLMLRKGS